MKKILSKGHTRGSRWIALPVLALTVLLSIVVAWCMEPPAENAELMYVFVDNDDQVHIIDREHQIAYETESLQFHTDTSAADLQILLRKKENVTITKDGETFTAAARRETVENLLRRMDLEPSDSFLKVDQKTSSPPAITSSIHAIFVPPDKKIRRLSAHLQRPNGAQANAGHTDPAAGMHLMNLDEAILLYNGWNVKRPPSWQSAWTGAYTAARRRSSAP